MIKRSTIHRWHVNNAMHPFRAPGQRVRGRSPLNLKAFQILYAPRNVLPSGPPDKNKKHLGLTDAEPIAAERLVRLFWSSLSSPTNLRWYQKTRMITLSCAIKISTVCSIVSSQSTRVTVTFGLSLELVAMFALTI